IRLVSQPTYTGRYNFKEDPLWNYKPVALPIDALAWYQCDHLGTPQEITDQNGNTAWSAQYKAWGEATEQRSEFAQQVGLTNPIRFQGQYHDHETGLHYNRHRYYDPKVGRFISKDPIGYSGGLNLYAYAANPVEWIDPLGLHKVIATNSRRSAMKKAQEHAQVPRVSKGGSDIVMDDLHPSSRGVNCACLKSRGITTLGRWSGTENKKFFVFDHPDGHPDLVGPGQPEHHERPHVHGKNKKGEMIIFTYPAPRPGR
ncbi:RHS repeat domain-containing protein, partial [Pseudomonas graminis]